MELYSRIFIGITTSLYVQHVTSHTTTVCCPVQEYRAGLHAHCMGRQLESFHCSSKASVWLDEKTEEICFNNNTKSAPISGRSSSPPSPRVIWLDVSSNSLASFSDISHRVFSDLNHLNLSHNRIQEFQVNPLQGVHHLQLLDLSFNWLSFVPEFSKVQLSDLRNLDLSRNLLQEVPGSAWKGLWKLETLMLDHNRISEVVSESFSGLTSLRVLVLHSNSLENLPLGVFDELSNLSELDLSDNALTSLPKSALRNLHQLKMLNLSYNKLVEISPGTLRGLTSLDTLDLAFNKIESISGSLFENLQKLQHLNLSQNEVKAISPDIFKGLEALKDLDLSKNKLTTIRKASFTPVNKLLRMKLSSNSLKRLPEHVFAGLRWLEVLDLSENQLQLDLESFPEDLFSPLHNLRYMFLHGNDFRSDGTYPSKVFTTLINLRHLSIDTFSETIFHQEFSLMSRLRKLDLPNCKMTSLKENTFEGFRHSNLKQLRMSGCPLSKVESCPFCGLKNLEWLSITNRSLPSTFVIQGILIDPTETSLRHLNFSDLNLHSDTVQALNDHTLKNLDQLEVLDLSRNYLRDMNMSLKEGIKEIWLSGNRFQSIPVNLTNLKRLIMLDMSHNNVSFLTPSERTALDKLADMSDFTLRLHGNRVACPREDCSRADFLMWFGSTNVRFDDGRTPGPEYPCLTKEGKSSTVEDALEKCTNWTSRNSTLFIAVLVVAMVVFTTSRYANSPPQQIGGDSPATHEQRLLSIPETALSDLLPLTPTDSGWDSFSPLTSSPHSGSFNKTQSSSYSTKRDDSDLTELKYRFSSPGTSSAVNNGNPVASERKTPMSVALTSSLDTRRHGSSVICSPDHQNYISPESYFQSSAGVCEQESSDIGASPRCRFHKTERKTVVPSEQQFPVSEHSTADDLGEFLARHSRQHKTERKVMLGEQGTSHQCCPTQRQGGENCHEADRVPWPGSLNYRLPQYIPPHTKDSPPSYNTVCRQIARDLQNQQESWFKS